MGLIERISTGITKLSEQAGRAIDEGRLRLDLQRERRRKDNAARDLGYLAYRQSQGASAPESEIESLKRRIADAEAAILRIEAEIQTVRAGQAEGRPEERGPTARSGGGAETTGSGQASPGEPPAQ